VGQVCNRKRRIMNSTHCPYFFTPFRPSPEAPLFVFLPGMDETGEDLIRLQVKGLETAFDVRCFVIPADHLTDWDDLSNHVVQLTRQALAEHPKSTVYLCGESFGACLALKALEHHPQLFQRIILINSASSFHRIWFYHVASQLLHLTPPLLYNLSALVTVPCLANLTRLSPEGIQALGKATREAPLATAQQRLELLRTFTMEISNLRQLTQPVLLIGSGQDRILPSRQEAQRLAQIFPHSTVLTLPHSGHACLAERDTHLLPLMQSVGFLPSQLTENAVAHDAQTLGA
jgi:pimeloyl-ACP methyl ester carboxylesterase